MKQIVQLSVEKLKFFLFVFFFFWLVPFTDKVIVMFTWGHTPLGIYAKNSKMIYEVLMLWNRFGSPQEVACIDTWELDLIYVNFNVYHFLSSLQPQWTQNIKLFVMPHVKTSVCTRTSISCCRSCAQLSWTGRTRRFWLSKIAAERTE